jgi:hypothetical protein
LNKLKNYMNYCVPARIILFVSPKVAWVAMWRTTGGLCMFCKTDLVAVSCIKGFTFNRDPQMIPSSFAPGSLLNIFSGKEEVRGTDEMRKKE